MFFLVVKKKHILLSIAGILILLLIITSLVGVIPIDNFLPASITLTKEEMSQVLDQMFQIRNKAMVENDLDTLQLLYDKSTTLGTWAFEHQIKKLKYLHNWADKQGVSFIEIRTKIVVRWTKGKGEKVTANFTASTEYDYVYENDSADVNMLRIGTYHEVDIIQKEDSWLIAKEWYTDPFADSLNSDNLKVENNKAFITSQAMRDLSNISQRRLDAVTYADKYCGAAANEEYGYAYNKKYKDYNPLGGDCANFASQVLFEGGKFRKTGSWKYEKDGSKAWVNAQAFKDFWLYSGRASLIAYGSYDKVLKASYKLLPGDFVAYEKKGKVVHISVVTGADSKGYSLVNCHNTDRYRVPWDLGWSDKGIRFWLVRVHF